MPAGQQPPAARARLACALLALLALPVAPAAAVEPGAARRAKVGLVLSGGGARGAAHIGVLRVLEQLRVPVDFIAGTSMGALVGGLYAAGQSVDDLEQAVRTIDWNAAFRDDLARADRSFHRKDNERSFLVKSKAGLKDGKLAFPKGLVQGQALDALLGELAAPAAGVDDFDRLAVPFRAVATDLSTGSAVVLGKGSLQDALRASMSIPGAVAPVELDGRALVDGGVSNNLPLDVARAMGAEVLVVVDISSPLEPVEDLNSVFAVTGQLTTIMTRQNTERQLATLRDGDVLIRPELGDIGTLDFLRAPEAVSVGAQATRAQALPLRRHALPARAYRAHLAARPQLRFDPPLIDFVRVENTSRLADDVILARLRLAPGERFDRALLDQDMRVIYGLEDFERVDYRLVEEDGRQGLVIEAVAKSWGPDFVQFGLSLENNAQGDTAFNVGAAYAMTALNRLGGEWRSEFQLGGSPRLFSEFHQPLDKDFRWFVVPQVEFKRFNFGVFDSGDEIAEYRIGLAEGTLAFGREFGTWGELRLGLVRGFGKAKLRVGDPVLPEGAFDRGGWQASLRQDRLDDVHFPRRGWASNLTFFSSEKALGADSNYQRLFFALTAPLTRGRLTVLPKLRLGGPVQGDLALEDRFFLGGFLNLSGLQRREISGQYSAFGALVSYYRINEESIGLDMPLYLGGSAELGGVWETRSDVSTDSLIAAGSLFLGLDTFFGPLFFAGGMAEGGNRSLYLFLGRTF